MDMRFGTWNVRSMYTAGSLLTVAKEISKYKLDLVGVQEVRWDRGGTEPAGEYIEDDLEALSSAINK
jgi:exonuclease III